MKRSIYLDHAAATPLDKNVLAAMRPYFSQKFYNPSASYLAARSVARDLRAARAQVARILGAKQTEITFTAGGTEANNLVVNGIMGRFPKGNVIVSAIEHESVLEPAKQYPHKVAPVKTDGIVDTARLVKLIDDNTVLVSVMYANNEVGTIQPIREIAKIIQVKLAKRANTTRTPTPYPLCFHADAAQAANYLDLHVSRLGVDLMTLNGGKIYGPKQSGALFVKTGVQLRPQILGGGQERGLRSGTENVAAIIGFATALELAQKSRRVEVERLSKIQKMFFEQLQQKLSEAVINGSRKHRLPNNIHITLPGHDNERLLMELDQAGIQAAAGSACSAANEGPSHVLKAMKISETDASSSLRFTMGRKTTKAEVVRTSTALTLILDK